MEGENIMNPCQAWEALLEDNDRGKIYDHFKRERKNLTDHLRSCNKCKFLIFPVDPYLTINLDHINQIDDLAFGQLVRELYKKYQGTFAP